MKTATCFMPPPRQSRRRERTQFSLKPEGSVYEAVQTEAICIGHRVQGAEALINNRVAEKSGNLL